MRIIDCIKHETKRHATLKFAAVALVAVSYFAFATYRYGADSGPLVALLSWSFFVFCTPIADAGLLLDFPLRLILGLRMIYAESAVWTLAASINAFALTIRPDTYQTTALLRIFWEIIHTPLLWVVFALSAAGTFLSIHFGDELMDKVRHEQREFYQEHGHKHRAIIMAFLIVLVIMAYGLVAKKAHIPIGF